MLKAECRELLLGGPLKIIITIITASALLLIIYVVHISTQQPEREQSVFFQSPAIIEKYTHTIAKSEMCNNTMGCLINAIFVNLLKT